MTVTSMAERGENDPVAALVERIRGVINEGAKPDLSDVHEAIKTAGIRAARRALVEAPDRIAEAQATYREAQAVEKAARGAYTQASAEADWTLDDRFKTDGNRTYLRLPCSECGGSGKVAETLDVSGDGFVKCEACDGLGTTRKAMAEPERKAWKAQEVGKVPAVQAAERVLRDSEEATSAARDEMGVAERRFSACKHDVTASVAELNILAVGLAAKGA